MASSTQVGNVTQVLINYRDLLNNERSYTPASKLKVFSSATMGNLNTSARAINAMTTNTYLDTILVTAVSVNEELEE